MNIVLSQQELSEDKSSIAELVAQHGSSSATAWLEFSRYKIWRPSVPIPESDFFPPVQGYMLREPYIFAWGNPLVSSPAALEPTARAFIEFAANQDLHLVWTCVDSDLEEVLADAFGWSTVYCIYEDYIDPAHVLELMSPDAKGQEGQHVVKDLKKNLKRAEKYKVDVKEVKDGEWTEDDKTTVEKGIEAWKAHRTGVQIASTTLQPWIDQEHRRYWLARQENAKIVGLLILTPVKKNTWQIKNAISFPDAPKGTSEALIYTAVNDIYEDPSRNVSSPTAAPLINGLKDSLKESSSSLSSTTVESSTSRSNSEAPPSETSSNGVISPISEDSLSGMETPGCKSRTGDENSALRDENRVAVTFGISAAPEMEAVHNLGGWKVKALSKTYTKVASSAKLVNRGEFRSKFDSEHEPMYVCYPPDGFGLDGVNSLFKLLRK